MKPFKIFQIASICIGISVAGVTVSHAQGRMTPEQRVQNKLDKMKSELNLSDDQVGKLKPIMIKEQEEMMKLRNNGTDPETMKTERKKIASEYQKQITAVLTPEQQQKLKTMKPLPPKPMPAGGATQMPAGGATQTPAGGATPKPKQ